MKGRLHRITPLGAFLPAVLAAVAALVLGCERSGGTGDVSGGLAIRDVNVIPMDGGAMLEGRTVVVRDGRVEGLYAPGEDLPFAPDTMLDGSGKFLAPGLVDAHAHVHVRSDLERYLVHGVTSVREMWGLPRSLRWRDATRAGRIPGPNLVVASTFFWMDGPETTRHVEPTDPETARSLVRQAADEGYDLIKVVSIPDMDVLRAVIDEAHASDLTVSGHYPDRSVSVTEMLDVGMSSFEHADEFTTIAFADDSSDEAIRRIAEALAGRGIGITTILTPARTYLEIDAKGADYYTPEARLEILERMGPYYFRDAGQTIDNVLTAGGEYVQQWTEGTALALRAAPVFLEAGVSLAIGTEGIGPFYEVAGVGVHDEMALLSQAGLSNEQVLRVATVNGAELLGFGDRKGRILPGFDADLLLLDGDPLEDLTTLRAPAAVLVMGRLYSRSDLDALARVY